MSKVLRLIEKLEKKFPKLDVRPSEEFDGHVGGLWITNASEATGANGLPLFDYYAEDNNEVTYVMSIHRDLITVLDSEGFFAEPHDTGTLMAWEA